MSLSLQSPPRRILITGSSGLIGRPLRAYLEREGHAAVGLDLRGEGPDRGDVRHDADLIRTIRGCHGVIHLAAISRVVDGERDPDACWQTNVEGTRGVLRAAEQSPLRPWVIYASSREVYGQPESLPASEEAQRAPVNIYGRSKVAAEDLCNASPLNTAVVRFSNVYGDTQDHVDRVVPAFARQAAQGQQLRVDGLDHTFDFTHIDDTVRGVLAAASALDAGKNLPPIHFLTGEPTTLGELAQLAIELAETNASFVEAPPRSFDVSTFYGDPRRAERLLDWKARVSLTEGLGKLTRDFKSQLQESSS